MSNAILVIAIAGIVIAAVGRTTTGLGLSLMGLTGAFVARLTITAFESEFKEDEHPVSVGFLLSSSWILPLSGVMIIIILCLFFFLDKKRRLED